MIISVSLYLSIFSSFKLHQVSNATELESQALYMGKLNPETTFYFVYKPAWHEFHEIGVDFLFEGQRNNHIPGNYHLSLRIKWLIE